MEDRCHSLSGIPDWRQGTEQRTVITCFLIVEAVPLCLPYSYIVALNCEQMKPFLSCKLLLLAYFISAAGKVTKALHNTLQLCPSNTLSQGSEEELPMGWQSETHWGGT